MSLTVRRNPEAFIAQLSQHHQTRGTLRVYLGYAAGTGKTCAMLSAAHGLLAEGVDVMVGLVETHGRAGTQALLEGLPMLQRKTFDYRGREMTELDLDAALERRPRVLLVDELAHSNVGDSRHIKRWGDVLELLQAGIEVHTTVNVQHLESVAEVVGNLTGVAITELVPDRVLEEAEEIVLIDLPPDDLLERLDAGKVYRPEQARRAREGFFKKTHLLALRELAMRNAAHHADEDARDHLRKSSLAGPWPAGERLLVCVGPSPYSERLIRATKRLADSMSASWLALHVDTGSLTPTQQERVDRHLQLAQRLGGKVRSEISHSLIEQVLDTAAAMNVTKIVTGRTPGSSPWQALTRPSLADQVLRYAPSLDVLVLAGAANDSVKPTRAPSRVSFKPYFAALALVAASTACGLAAGTRVNLTVQLMVYVAAVVASAYFHGGKASTFTSLLASLALNFFFVPPVHTFTMADPSYWVTLFGLTLNGHLISRLTATAREQAQSARRRETEALTLLSLSRDLAGAADTEALVQTAQKHLQANFGEVILLLQGAEDRLASTSSLDPAEIAVADRCLRSGAAVGKGTDTLPGANHQWFPLKGPSRVLGVAGLVRPVALGARRREDLLEAILNQVSAALERRDLSEKAKDAELLQASEKLHKALLRSVSHDLRIPLVAIQGTLSSLQAVPAPPGEKARRRQAMISNALSEAQRLDRLVGNMLQKTRLETGHLSVKTLLCDVEDLVSTTVAGLRYRIGERPVTTLVPTDLPLVPMDFVLISQVLTNLLENAITYSPAQSPIEIAACARDTELVVEVRDRGVGLAEEETERLFGCFERGRSNKLPGTGLGLSICRGLVEAHQGRIEGRSRQDGGSVFAFTLPLEVNHA